MKQTFILDFDDLAFGSPGLEEVMKLKEHYPNLKVTFFTIPVPECILKREVTPAKYKEWAKVLKDMDWIEICPHGFTHQESEFLLDKSGKKIKLLDYETAKLYIQAAEKTFNEIGLPFKKIWKSPYWETSPEAYKAIMNMNYEIACDPNQPHPDGAYLYDWSIDKRIPLRPVVRGHGHLYGNNENNIQKCMENLLDIPTGSEFKFVSEAIKERL